MIDTDGHVQQDLSLYRVLVRSGAYLMVDDFYAPGAPNKEVTDERRAECDGARGHRAVTRCVWLGDLAGSRRVTPMCGIAGLFSANTLVPDAGEAMAVLRQMTGSMVHRGPDATATGPIRTGDASLGIAGSSIIDTSTPAASRCRRRRPLA